MLMEKGFRFCVDRLVMVVYREKKKGSGWCFFVVYLYNDFVVKL